MEPLGDLAPDSARSTLLRPRSEGVAELMTRLDDRWDYYVATLSASGPMGIILKD